MGTLIDLTGYFNFPPMFFYDTVTGGKTQSGSTFFGGEKRIEYLLDNGLRDSYPGIRNLYPGKLLIVIIHPEAQLATLGHGLGGINSQIEKKLLEVAEIPQNPRILDLRGGL